jgi:integrase
VVRNRHLTDALVRRLPAPERGNRLFFDDAVRGFAARVTAAGDRSYVLDYRTSGGRQRRYTIGAAAHWATTAAREEAKRLRSEIDQGADPVGARAEARGAPTVAELCDRFEAEYVVRKRPTTVRDYCTVLRLYVRPHFGNRIKVADVQFADIDALHRKVTKEGGPYQGNRMHAVVRRMFELAIRWGLRDDNPCKGIERNLEHHRRRYLSGEELVRLTAALAAHTDQQSANAVRMLLLTGARKGEVLSMRWADLDLTDGIWSKPPSSTKQKQFHQVPLSAPARQLLSEIREQRLRQRRTLGTYVFPSVSTTGHQLDLKKSWRSLCRSGNIADLRPHDLRHSYASQLASAGASLVLIGSLLGHANPSTTARYSHLFSDVERAATERVGAIISNAGKDVVEPTPLPTTRRRDR